MYGTTYHPRLPVPTYCYFDATAAQMHEVHPELLRYTRELARRQSEQDFGRSRPGLTVVAAGPRAEDVCGLDPGEPPEHRIHVGEILELARRYTRDAARVAAT